MYLVWNDNGIFSLSLQSYMILYSPNMDMTLMSWYCAETILVTLSSFQRILWPYCVALDTVNRNIYGTSENIFDANNLFGQLRASYCYQLEISWTHVVCLCEDKNWPIRSCYFSLLANEKPKYLILCVPNCPRHNNSNAA